MIKRTRQAAENRNPRYTVADCETDSTGRVLLIGLAWYDDHDQRCYISFTRWLDFIEFVVELAKQNKAYRWIYAHNGANFDWLSLAQDLQGSGLKYSLRAIIAGSEGIGIDIRVNDRLTLRLRDSLHLLPKSLAQLGEEFQTEHRKLKLEGILPADLAQSDRDIFDAYNQLDCYALQDVLRAFHLIINRYIGPLDRLPMTAASLSMRMWQSCYMNAEIPTTWNPEQKAFFRRAYHGGRCSVLRPGIHKNVTAYDINANYCFVMRDQQFPLGYMGAWTDRFHEQELGIYEVTFEQPDHSLPPLLMDEESHDFQYQGRGVFCSPELQQLRLIGGQFQLQQGWFFARAGNPFHDYMARLWDLRREAQRQRNRGLDRAVKSLANSLYGKFGQKAERTVIRSLKPGELRELLANGAHVEQYDDYVLIREPAHMEHEFVALAAFVTSYARVLLYRWLLAAGADACYCDTDSVHTTGRLPEGAGLGELKIEHRFAQVVYLRRKSYAYRLEDGSEGFAIKGLPTAPVTLEELKEMYLFEKRKTVQYETPPTIHEVLLQKRPAARWRTRSYTIDPLP
jgi:hypothetical protein